MINNKNSNQFCPLCPKISKNIKCMENSRLRNKHILIIVQNLPVPFDRRVWQEANTLAKAGYKVSIICPKGKAYTKTYERINDIDIYRHPLPIEAKGALGYLLEYSSSLIFEFYFACKVFLKHGFDAIQACNPPDNIFLIAGFFKLFGKKFIFDHHDINPELYLAKFGKQDFFYKLMLFCEKLTFLTCDISIATNDSYKKIAIERGKMAEDKVFVVRSGPSLERMKIIPPLPNIKMGRKFLVGYVGVIGEQEGIKYLLEAARYIIHDLNRTDIHFALVGGGSALAQMQELAKQKNISDFVTFTGRVDDNKMLEVLNTADICVNPDEVNEMNDKSTMNKIMEYMALAKPIVQFDVTEGRISAGEASFYAKANDAKDFAEKMIKLLSMPEESIKMGQIGKERIETKLAWQHEEPKLLAAYQKLFSI